MKISVYLSVLIWLLGTACNSSKHVVGKPSVETKPSFAAVAKEYNLFFEAENARLLGDRAKAYKLYKELSTKFPNNATALYNFARIQFQKKELVEAEENAEKALKLDPQNKYYQELYTQLLVFNRKLKKAQTQYSLMLKREPRNQEYLYEQSLLYLKAGNFDKSLESLNQLEKLMGFNEDIILQRKSLLLQQGRVDEAIVEVRKLQQSDKGNLDYPLMLIDIYEGSKQALKVNEVYKEIETDYALNPLAQLALAEYYQKRQDPVRYKEFMNKVMQNRNMDVQTKIALITPSLRNFDTDSVKDQELIIEWAKSIHEESPQSKEAIGLYADVLFVSKKYSSALENYKKYLSVDSSNFTVWNQIMSIYFDQLKYDSVLYFAKPCTQIFPKNPMPAFYTGIVHQQNKNYDAAIIAYQKTIKLETKNGALLGQVYANLGDIYQNQGDFEKSDSCFDKSLVYQPDEATTLNNYAYYLSLRKQRLNEAEMMSKKSLVLQPDSKSFLDTYGWIRYEQGDYEDARKYIEKAIQAGGEEDGTLFHHLGDVLYKLGQQSKALENWKKAKEKGENSPELLKKIKEGKHAE